jgi:hypothetical protein
MPQVTFGGPSQALHPAQIQAPILACNAPGALGPWAGSALALLATPDAPD